MNASTSPSRERPSLVWEHEASVHGSRASQALRKRARGLPASFRGLDLRVAVQSFSTYVRFRGFSACMGMLGPGRPHEDGKVLGLWLCRTSTFSYKQSCPHCTPTCRNFPIQAYQLTATNKETRRSHRHAFAVLEPQPRNGSQYPTGGCTPSSFPRCSVEKHG